MSPHTDAHEQSLSRLASGELSRDVPQTRELLACAQCRAEAKDLLEIAERLGRMDTARASILGELAQTEPDPRRASRALRSVEQAQKSSRDGVTRRRLRRFLTAVAATVAIGLALSLWSRSGGDPEDGRGALLGTEQLAITATLRAADGGIELRANRNPRAGCTLSFVVLTSPERDLLGTFASSSAACSIPRERTAEWPESLEVYVQERDAANEPLVSSPPQLWSSRP